MVGSILSYFFVCGWGRHLPLSFCMWIANHLSITCWKVLFLPLSCLGRFVKSHLAVSARDYWGPTPVLFTCTPVSAFTVFDHDHLQWFLKSRSLLLPPLFWLFWVQCISLPVLRSVHYFVERRKERQLGLWQGMRWICRSVWGVLPTCDLPSCEYEKYFHLFRSLISGNGILSLSVDESWLCAIAFSLIFYPL